MPADRSVKAGLYANTRYVWHHVQAVGDFYGTHAYIGSLSTDGEPLPDGRLDAIPLDPQVADDDADPGNVAIKRAVAQLWQLWQWQNMMSIPPLYAAVLGDCFISLVDDARRQKVMPNIIWPGYVTDTQLDEVGNVKAITERYRVKKPEGTFYGVFQRGEEYDFRKEVDQEAFRYFRDDKPYDEYGEGPVVPNPYGFVPYVQLRYKPTWGVRGMSVIDGTLGALNEVNSFFSHAIDYQRKAFAMPIMVIGMTTAAGQRSVQVGRPPDDESFDDVVARTLAQSQDVLPARDGGDIKQATFDVGQTIAMFQELKTGILNESPEAKFYEALGNLSQATGPGIERALGDATNRMKKFRANTDPQYVKLFQMAITMMGQRIRDGDYGQLKRWHEPFAPFDLASYDDGALDFTIKDRPVVPETETERLAVEQARANVVLTRKQLSTEAELVQAGVSDEDAKVIIAERRAAAEESARLFDAGGNPSNGQQDEEAFGR